MSSEKEPVEDFLTVDDPIRGQNFVCISFLSPENVIKDKNTYILHEFLKDISSKYDISHQDLIDN